MPAALEFAAATLGRDHPNVLKDSLHGYAIVRKDNYIPLHFGFCYFEPEGVVSVHARLGDVLRTYPKEILAQITKTIREVREVGVNELYAIADEDIYESQKFIEWFDAKPTGKKSLYPPIGDVYRIDLYSEKMDELIKRRGY